VLCEFGALCCAIAGAHRATVATVARITLFIYTSCCAWLPLLGIRDERSPNIGGEQCRTPKMSPFRSADRGTRRFCCAARLCRVNDFSLRSVPGSQLVRRRVDVTKVLLDLRKARRSRQCRGRRCKNAPLTSSARSSRDNIAASKRKGILQALDIGLVDRVERAIAYAQACSRSHRWDNLR
jgi:hypothetical protein